MESRISPENPSLVNPSVDPLFEEFQQARCVAIEATDRYHDSSPDDPTRPVLWEIVVDLTKKSKESLLQWLDTPADR